MFRLISSSLIFVFLCLLSISPCFNAWIHSRVLRTLKTQDKVNVMVRMKQSNQEIFNSPRLLESVSEFDSRGKRIQTLVDSLEKHTQTSQKKAMELIQQNQNQHKLLDNEAKVRTEHFWITNAIYIQNANKKLLQQLNELEEVDRIEEEKVLQLEPITYGTSQNKTSFEWGLKKIQAMDAWKFGQTKGKGIVVANIDTGVQYTHESLKENYRGGEYSWFDPFHATETPVDDNGHGTHTMGTIAGSNGIGVSPESQWIACRGCTNRGCSEAGFLKCGQFMTCPTDVKGENKNCEAAPHLVSNSWSFPRGYDWHKEVTRAWQEAGIIPIFSIGNIGPYCGNVRSPGDQLDVIGVGATTSSDSLARFSSVGPRKGGGDRVKPDISAPGQDVRSAWIGKDNEYKTISGTSMATPHVSGVIALMLANKKGLKYEEIYKLITETADQDTLKLPGKNCGGIEDSSFPNNMVGYGRINAMSILKKLKGDDYPTDAPTNNPTDYPTDAHTDYPTSKPVTCKWNWNKFICEPHEHCQFNFKKFYCVRNS